MEVYSPGYNKEILSSFSKRSVNKEAAFFMPHIQKGSIILDCGCGPGTITIGMAMQKGIRKVIGIDISENQINSCRQRARQMKCTNVEFLVADIYNLQLPNNSIDAVFANGLFQHLERPEKALAEIKRVLKTNGVVGVRDDDHGSMIISPSDKKIDKMLSIFNKVMEHSGGNPNAGRYHKALLIDQGFINPIVSVSCEYDKNKEETYKRACIARELLNNMEETIVEYGWATKVEIEDMKVSIDNWGRNPGAFNSTMWCEVVAFKK